MNVVIIPQELTDGLVRGHYFKQPDYQLTFKEIIEEEIVNEYEIY